MVSLTPTSLFIRRLSHFAIFLIIAAAAVCAGCSDDNQDGREGESLRRALGVQRLRNLADGREVSGQIAVIVDSMRQARHDIYYFSAVNVLIDQLFTEGKFAMADSLASEMIHEAAQERDSVAQAIAHRIRGQMFYKLSRQQKAYDEFRQGRSLLPDSTTDLQVFSNTASIEEWIWIAAHALNDTAGMNRYVAMYAESVARMMVTGWRDSTAHFPVTALAFEASRSLSEGDPVTARHKLTLASGMIDKKYPANAYEHFYEVRSRLNAATGNIDEAVADIDTLIAAYRSFPWFLRIALRDKANLLAGADRNEEAVAIMSRLIMLNDSLNSEQTDRQLSDLTTLYRSELDREHRNSEHLKTISLIVIIALLTVMLVISFINVRRQRRKNIILIERMRDFDKQRVACRDDKQPSTPGSVMELLDRKMLTDRYFTNPALGRKELAAMVGLTPDELGAMIKAERGQTVVGYINACRAEEARRILEAAPDTAIATIAADLGFGTPRTMQRVFHLHFGMSPTQFKELSKESRNR